jgi:hypothetical protein
MSRPAKYTLRILGTCGVPAAHGGFETFAEHLALYLIRRGWRVIVYCQEDRAGATTESIWEGIERITIPISQSGPRKPCCLTGRQFGTRRDFLIYV